MKTTDSTILITGGGSGIGRGLAEAFHALGNRVIISGRGRKALDETVAANPGIAALTVDLADPTSLRDFAARLEREHPDLDAVVHNAGIMRPENLLDGTDTADAEAMIATNLLGPIRLTAALLPRLIQRSSAAIMTVSSGLAFVPLASTPTYCATKAAIHSYTESLRYQLKGTPVQVLELVPPYVATTLMGAGQAADSRAMPLGEFIAEVMEILKSQPDATEICVKRVGHLRGAAEGGREAYERRFAGLNAAMASVGNGAK